MSEEIHPLTAVASKSPARIACLIPSTLATAFAFLALFVLFPNWGWNDDKKVYIRCDQNFLIHSFADSFTSSIPAWPNFSAENIIDKAIMLSGYIIKILLVPLITIDHLGDALSAADVGLGLELRLFAIIGSAIMVSVPIYRSVYARTPKLRTATRVDGPRVWWLGAALADVRRHLQEQVGNFVSGVALAPGLILPRRAEYESFFALGLPGSGKSVIVDGVAKQALERDGRAILLDVKGNLHRRVAQIIGRAKTIVIGIGHATDVWAIGRDIRDRARAHHLASILIPDSRDPVWSAAARLVLTAIIMWLVKAYDQDWGWSDLRRIIDLPIEKISAEIPKTMRRVSEILRGKDGDPTNMAISVILNMVAHCSAIIDDCADLERQGAEEISLSGWADGTIEQRAVVLQHELDRKEASETLLTAVLDFIAGHLLGPSIEDGIDHDVWVFADELARFPRAIGSIGDLAALGRSRGIRTVATAQSFAQLEEIRGRAGAEALIENFSKVIVCKTRPGKNAETLSELFIGKSTYEIPKTSKDGEPTLERHPALSPQEMSTCLGLTTDWRGRKAIRAAVVGMGDIHILEWSLDRWPRI